MEILEAYCEDLGRIVEIYDAQEEFFAQAEGKRHRFRFRCSDDDCRAAKNPLVVGVNYDKNVEDSEKYQQPHFKSHPNHPHLATCKWMESNANKYKGNSCNKKRNACHPRPKATNVIDVFAPRNSDSPAQGSTFSNTQQPAPVPDDSLQKNTAHASPHTGTTTTSRLQKLVDCWSNMTKEERKRHHITIKGHTITYYKLCIKPENLFEKENGMRVVWGNALPPKRTPSHYRIKFYGACKRFPPVEGGQSLTISLSRKRLEQHRRGSLLMDCMEQSRQRSDQYYLRVYAWGNILARTDNNEGYELQIDSLDNLVLKLHPKNPPITLNKGQAK